MKTISKKIVLLGNEAVGKTSLVKRYVNSIFNDEYLTTIGIKISKKEVVVEDVKVSLMIWDIAGNMMNKALYDKYLSGAHGLFLVCDATRKKSYDNIILERDSHLAIDFKETKTLILVNKIDLIEEDSSPIFGGSNYDFLTSAKTGVNVENAFKKMAEITLLKS